MQETKNKDAPTADQELIDVLIAISVVAKRLARKLEIQRKEDNNGQNERTVGNA